MLTCIGVLQLYEQGKFTLYDPISKYLPEFERMKITSNAINAEEAKKITTGNVMGGSEEITDDGYAKNKLSLTYFQHVHNWDVKIQSEIRNALYSCFE